MLRQALGRSLQTPAAAQLRSRATTQWARAFASNRRGLPKKPNEYQRPPGSASQTPKPSPVDSQKAAGVGLGSGAIRSPAGAFSKTQEQVVNKSASPDRNTTSQHVTGGAGAPSSGAAPREDNTFSAQQDEFKTSASPSQNTAPQSTSSNSVEPTETYNGTLPDLTQGIPSTIDYELNSKARGQRLDLDVTGDSEASGGSGRGRGELPASAYISSSEKKRDMVANYMYAAFAIFSATGYVYLGRNWESDEEERRHPDAPSGWSLGGMWSRAKARLGGQLAYYHEPAFKKLLPDPDPSFERPYTLVVSLEDLLIHSEWTREHGWRMAKRPGVDYFLRYLSQYYEIVLFTTVPWAIAEPVVRKLDPFHIITWPLYREATMYKDGEYVKVDYLPLHIKL